MNFIIECDDEQQQIQVLQKLEKTRLPLAL